VAHAEGVLRQLASTAGWRIYKPPLITGFSHYRTNVIVLITPPNPKTYGQ